MQLPTVLAYLEEAKGRIPPLSTVVVLFRCLMTVATAEVVNYIYCRWCTEELCSPSSGGQERAILFSFDDDPMLPFWV